MKTATEDKTGVPEYVKVDFYQDLSKEGNIIPKTFFKRNDFYKQVLDDNKTGAFRSDIYSEQFHEFIPELFQLVIDKIGADGADSIKE